MLTLLATRFVRVYQILVLVDVQNPFEEVGLVHFPFVQGLLPDLPLLNLLFQSLQIRLSTIQLVECSL